MRGAGVGIYNAERADIDITAPRDTFNGGGGQSHAHIAWHIIAGTDYYWTSKFSTFIEYPYLNYTSTQIDTNRSRDLGQHLVGAVCGSIFKADRVPLFIGRTVSFEYYNSKVLERSSGSA